MDYKEKYQLVRPKHEEFSVKLHSLIKELLSDNDIKVQHIECRTKTIESFLEKLDRDGKSYKDPLKEMTDLSGIRIILYYLDDVEKVEDIFKSQFEVDPKNSINKKDVLDFDQFGYLSVHQIINLKRPRIELPEWKKFHGFTAEIQIRTVLQHSWASISHTLQYKNEKDIPKELRRQLHRLAGLFELADEEFLDIKEKKESLIVAINSSLEISKFKIPLNLDSLMSYFDSSKIIEQISLKGYKAGFKKAKDEKSRYQLSLLNKVCNELQIVSIDKLDHILQELEKTSIDKFKEFLTPSRSPYASPEHLITLLLLIANKAILTKEKIKSLVTWSPEYINRI